MLKELGVLRELTGSVMAGHGLVPPAPLTVAAFQHLHRMLDVRAHQGFG